MTTEDQIAKMEKLNGFHSGYLLYGATCENCDNNTLGYKLRKRIKCLEPGKCPIVIAKEKDDARP